MNFAEEFKKLREKTGLMVQSVSRLSGVSVERLQAIENGDVEPTSKEIKALCEFYAVPADDYLKSVKEEIVEEKKPEENTKLDLAKYVQELSSQAVVEKPVKKKSKGNGFRNFLLFIKLIVCLGTVGIFGYTMFTKFNILENLSKIFYGSIAGSMLLSSILTLISFAKKSKAVKLLGFLTSLIAIGVFAYICYTKSLFLYLAAPGGLLLIDIILLFLKKK